jgi:hypothetical protein
LKIDRQASRKEGRKEGKNIYICIIPTYMCICMYIYTYIYHTKVGEPILQKLLL